LKLNVCANVLKHLNVSWTYSVSSVPALTLTLFASLDVEFTARYGVMWYH